MNCIDITARYGHRYRISFDECQSKTGLNDPWFARIMCQHGHIYPHGGETLAASVNTGHVIVAKKLKQLSCVTVHQDGDLGELTVLFDIADFEPVAAILKPHRKRVLSEGHRSKLAKAGAVHRFQPSSTGLVAEKRGEKLV